MTYDTAKQAADILYEMEECEMAADQLSNMVFDNPKLSLIVHDAVTAIGCYKDELNRKLIEL